MIPATLARYWHTLRWLRPVQVYGRLWFRLQRPRPDLRPAPPLREGAGAAWMPGARVPSMTGPDRFRFLAVERRLAEAADWNRPDWPKLWLYNAHYFDDLLADGAAQRVSWHRDLIARWIAQNPPGQGNGWEPYPTSLRIVNWIAWLLAGNAPDSAMLHSLAVQARWLRRRLEVHLLGNHLWANAKALVFAGSFFAGPQAEAWRARGLALLRRELEEQWLADGGHFERSPMYHAIVLADLLDLIQLTQCHPGLLPTPDVQRWREQVPRMLRWLRVMSHPDGGIAFFNDAALDIAPGHAALAERARALGLKVDQAPLAAIEALADSGYVRLAAGPAVLIADVGAIGPDYLPGHAHADTLSFELSLDGRRMLVNSGTSVYAPGIERQRQRATPAHNTVVVDGADSSEVWGSFRVARRARVSRVCWGREGGVAWIEAAHDGYQRLQPPALHWRRWVLDDGSLVVIDRVAGGAGRSVARFHFHPGMAFQPADGASMQDRLADLSWTIDGGVGRTLPTSWHPRFGESVATTVLAVSMHRDVLQTTFRWRAPADNRADAPERTA
ncbi:heparinase II/III family protein [Dokdonella sp.]|uniref:heparinase II/III family protein n=1 Tax=Dokdonella sp. TaxID=2291710 RepID=UPI0031BBFA0D|nr:heparinase II/III family protein [Dokdonella sp.]